MRDKFHLDAGRRAPVAARPARARLCRVGESLFERTIRITIVTTDYIKSDATRRLHPGLPRARDRRRGAHLRRRQRGDRGGRHQRYQLVCKLTADESRHVILVTATPHSGKEDAFRGLVGFLDPSFRDLPEDLSTDERSRASGGGSPASSCSAAAATSSTTSGDTPFPRRERLGRRAHLRPLPRVQALFTKVLAYARETIIDPADGGMRRQRVRWWAALGLLRASPPARAAAA